MSDGSPKDTDRLIDELVARDITRRRLLRGAGSGLLGLSFLAACGGQGLEKGGGATTRTEPEVIAKGEVSKTLSFSNWPLYIDVNERTKRRPTLDKFQKEFGTKVKYTEEINDNVEFFGKVQPQLSRGSSGGRDLFVVSDWMAGRMIQLGYVQKLDKAELGNVDENLLDALREPGFDPQRDFSVPWQSGMTGLAYRSDLTGGELESVNDLFNEDFKGKVTMLTEMRDSVGLVMLGMGNNPAEDENPAALEAIQKIKQASDSGQIRRFTGNDFTKDLLKGDAWVSVAWSGDSIQLQADNPDIRFLRPEEGSILWSDNMMIPVGAPNAYTAQKMMNFVYDPEIQADIAAYVNYVTPVQGVKEILAEEDPDLAEEPLIFPSEEDLAEVRIFRSLSAKEDDELNKAFQAVVGA